MTNQIYNTGMKNIIFTVLLTFLLTSPSFAQDDLNELQGKGREVVREKMRQKVEEKVPEQPLKQMEKFFPETENVDQKLVTEENRSTITNILESTVMKDKHAGAYQESTVQNLSKLYWMKDVLDIKNDKAIDNFILINECKFYNDNITNDFKWAKIRDAARQMILEEKSTYKDKFKIVVPIDLGRYDVEKQGFPLINDTAFDELRRIEVGGNDSPICGKRWDIPYYPKNVYLIMNKPFNYDFVNIDEHVAQAYVVRNDYIKPERPKELLSKAFNRLAFARIRMSFMEYQGVSEEKLRKPKAVMFGRIDGIDIFENPDETGILSSVDYEF